MVHVGTKIQKWPKLAGNAHTHGWGKCGTCLIWTAVCPRVMSYVSNIPLWALTKPPWIWDR